MISRFFFLHLHLFFFAFIHIVIFKMFFYFDVIKSENDDSQLNNQLNSQLNNQFIVVKNFLRFASFSLFTVMQLFFDLTAVRQFAFALNSSSII